MELALVFPQGFKNNPGLALANSSSVLNAQFQRCWPFSNKREIELFLVNAYVAGDINGT